MSHEALFTTLNILKGFQRSRNTMVILFKQMEGAPKN